MYIFQKNVFGDVTHIYDTEGTLHARYIYDAWGNHTVVNDTDTEIGTINPIRYRSYYYDTETNLYYLRARYYDSETGRFISQDNVSYLSSRHLSGLNLYAYCNDNPVTRYDPSGCFALTTFLICVGIGAFVGGAVSFGETVYQDYKDDGDIFNGSISASTYVSNTITGTIVGGSVGAIIGTGNVALVKAGAIAVSESLLSDAVSSAVYGTNNFGNWTDYGTAFVFGSLTAGLPNYGKIIANFTVSLATSAIKEYMDIFTNQNNYTRDMFWYDTGSQSVVNGTLFEAVFGNSSSSKIFRIVLQGLITGWKTSKYFK